MVKLTKLIVSLATSFSAGFIGSVATTPHIPTWYASLEKPFFNPPNWVFGPVWTTLYILIGLSLYLIWTTRTTRSKQRAFMWYGAQLALNALWSLVFFGLHAPEAAIVVIVVLLVSILMAGRYFWSISRIAAFLLVPYIIWVGFATVLNVAIAVLN